MRPKGLKFMGKGFLGMGSKPPPHQLRVWVSAVSSPQQPQMHFGCTSEVGGLQDGHLGFPFVVWYGSGLPGHWFSAVIWKRSSSAVFCWFEELRRQTYSNFGDRCFAAAGPRLWSSLPAGLGQTDICYEQFKRLLKTYLFGCCDRGTLWQFV